MEKWVVVLVTGEQGLWYVVAADSGERAVRVVEDEWPREFKRARYVVATQFKAIVKEARQIKL